VEFEGDIQWRGDYMVSFHHRYLVLANKVLQIYKSKDVYEGDEPCVEYFSLSRLEIERDAGTTSKGFVFSLFDNAGRSMDLACSSSEERGRWLECLERALERVTQEERAAPFLVIDHVPLHEVSPGVWL
jgi:hypothetical protein